MVTLLTLLPCYYGLFFWSQWNAHDNFLIGQENPVNAATLSIQLVATFWNPKLYNPLQVYPIQFIWPLKPTMFIFLKGLSHVWKAEWLVQWTAVQEVCVLVKSNHVKSLWMGKFCLSLANAFNNGHDQGACCLSAVAFSLLTFWHVQFSTYRYKKYQSFHFLFIRLHYWNVALSFFE